MFESRFELQEKFRKNKFYVSQKNSGKFQERPKSNMVSDTVHDIIIYEVFVTEYYVINWFLQILAWKIQFLHYSICIAFMSKLFKTEVSYLENASFKNYIWLAFRMSYLINKKLKQYLQCYFV